MPTPDEIARRNRSSQAAQEEEKLYQEWMKHANKYDGTKPVEFQSMDGPVAQAVADRFRREGWKVQHIPCGGRTPYDTWKLSG